jgi:hypothetical protein
MTHLDTLLVPVPRVEVKSDLLRHLWGRASMASSGTWHRVFAYDPHSLWVHDGGRLPPKLKGYIQPPGWRDVSSAGLRRGW